MSARRIGILGGTFDPIHNGHLIAAEQAVDALHLDQVLFLPAATPSFKRDKHVTPAQDRVAMVRAAIADNARFDIDTIEVDRGGVSYTAETLRALSQRYEGQDVKLFFLTGTDAAATLPTWKDSADILRLAQVVALSRPGYELPQDLRDLGVMHFEINAMAVSSSLLRQRMAAGQTVRYLMPKGAIEYAIKRGLYGLDSEGEVDAGAGCSIEADLSIPDALSDQFFAAREADLRQRVSKRRIEHIMGVAETSQRLAQVYGVDQRKAYLAGLLHDWDKAYDDAGIRQRVADLGVDIDPVVLTYMPQTIHGITAAVALGRQFPQIPADVLQAVDRHTTAADDMSPLDMVVYIADAIEPGRRYPDAEELRQMVGEVGLEDLFVRILGYWTAVILRRCATVHPDTARIWNSYAIKHKKGREFKAGDDERRMEQRIEAQRAEDEAAQQAQTEAAQQAENAEGAKG